MRGVGWEAHATSRDPTLDAVGTRSCAIRRGMSKNVQRQYLTCPSELVPPRVSYTEGSEDDKEDLNRRQQSKRRPIRNWVSSVTIQKALLRANISRLRFFTEGVEERI